MSANTPIGWKGLLVTAFVLAFMPGASTSQADVEVGVAGVLAGSGVEDEGFKLAVTRSSVPEDGWPQFEYAGQTFKFGAPTPAVPLDDAERKQWRKDVATFEFDKLRDRQPLYVYYLWTEDAEKAEAQAVLDAVNKAGDISTAIGVEYNISDEKLPIAADLYRSAALPVKWDEASYAFIVAEHDPETIAGLIKATAMVLPTGTYANFGAVENWSASVKATALMTGSVPSKSLPPSEIAYWKTVSQVPFTWTELTPITSFIAVDRKLDIQGLEGKPILTSKGAWKAMSELGAYLAQEARTE